MGYLWDAFGQLSSTRLTQVIASPTGALPLPAPISFAEIEAFARMTGADLTISDVQIIRRLDQQYIRIASGLPEPDAPKPSLGAMLRERARQTKPKRNAT